MSFAIDMSSGVQVTTYYFGFMNNSISNYII
jgi:hypothetical protein